MENSLLGKGLKYPLEFTNGKLVFVLASEKIKQNIWFIVNTQIGTVFFKRIKGWDKLGILFRGNTTILAERIEQNLKEAIETQEPRVTVNGFAFEQTDNSLDMKIDITITATGESLILNQNFNLQ